MKNLLTRCFLIGLVAVFCGLVSGCEEPKKPFDLTVSSFGPDYIEVKVTAATPVEMSYVVTTTNQNMSNPAVLYATGTKLNVTDGQVVRITEEIVQDTEYFMPTHLMKYWSRSPITFLLNKSIFLFWVVGGFGIWMHLSQG